MRSQQGQYHVGASPVIPKPVWLVSAGSPQMKGSVVVGKKDFNDAAIQEYKGQLIRWRRLRRVGDFF